MTTETAQPGATATARKEVPQYRLIGPVYVNERLYTQGEIDRASEDGRPIVINFKGIPNMNMLPANDAAREMVRKNPLPTVSTIEALTRVTPDAPKIPDTGL